jgi:predicted transcriptional regulator
MERKLPRLPDLELEVMLAVWKSETVPHTGEIHQRLSSGKKRPIQVVQTVLGRLEDKGFLKREKLGRLNYYAPLVEEEAYRANETASFLAKLYGNSPARLVAALLNSESTSEEDLAEIRQMLKREAE